MRFAFIFVFLLLLSFHGVAVPKPAASETECAGEEIATPLSLIAPQTPLNVKSLPDPVDPSVKKGAFIAMVQNPANPDRLQLDVCYNDAAKSVRVKRVTIISSGLSGQALKIFPDTDPKAFVRADGLIPALFGDISKLNVVINIMSGRYRLYVAGHSATASSSAGSPAYATAFVVREISPSSPVPELRSSILFGDIAPTNSLSDVLCIDGGTQESSSTPLGDNIVFETEYCRMQGAGMSSVYPIKKIRVVDTRSGGAGPGAPASSVFFNFDAKAIEQLTAQGLFRQEFSHHNWRDRLDLTIPGWGQIHLSTNMGINADGPNGPGNEIAGERFNIQFADGTSLTGALKGHFILKY